LLCAFPLTQAIKGYKPQFFSGLYPDHKKKLQKIAFLSDKLAKLLAFLLGSD